MQRSARSSTACADRDAAAIVIGAGPAGSLAALELARRGVSTLLVDRASHPRDKVCGCCLAPAGQRALHEAGLSAALDGARALATLRISARGRVAVIRKSGYVVIGRDALDGALAGAAVAAGAAAAWRTSARVSADGAVTLRAQDGPVQTVRHAVVVCADGLQGSSLTGHPNFRWKIARGSRIGLGASLEANACDIPPDEIRMIVVDAGYVGLVRLPGGRVDIAAAVDPIALRAAGGPLALLGTALRANGCVAAALESAGWSGTPTLTRTRTPLAAGRVLLAGDAASYVEPFTGEGMSWAIATGLAAGAHAAEMIAGSAVAHGWIARHAAITRRSRWRCSAVAVALRSPKLVSCALRLASRAPRTASAFARPFGAAAGVVPA